MTILTKRAISLAVEKSDIIITPFSYGCLNPNSYNYHLGPALQLLPNGLGDSRRRRHGRVEPIPPEGTVLKPGQVYLGNTVETIGSAKYVPSLIGRSSLGRLGMFLQISADLGNLGAVHQWTLEIVVTQPLRVYSGMRAGQVTFWVPTGAQSEYHGTMGQYSTPTESIPTPLGIELS
jgi:dCTP deaminase